MDKPSDNIVVMPEQFYGSRPQAGSFHRAEEQVIKQAAVAAAGPKKKSFMPIWMIVLLLLLLGVSGWLLYSTYLKPAPEPTPIKQPVVVTQPIETTEPEEYTPPEIIEEPVEIIEPEVIEPEPATKSYELAMTTDTDADGLTDSEELLIGTKVDQTDTDGDGYSDSQELLNLFNPLAATPSQIELSPAVTTYVNPTYDYNVFYPVKWLAKAVDKANVEIMFSSTLGEFVDVLVEENTDNLDLRAWYKKMAPDVTDDQIESFTNKAGLPALMSPDKMTVYIAKGRFVYVITYNIGLKEAVDYPNLFKMMYESFTFTGESNGETASIQ
jgi:hypothetical protein